MSPTIRPLTGRSNLVCNTRHASSALAAALSPHQTLRVAEGLNLQRRTVPHRAMWARLTLPPPLLWAAALLSASGRSGASRKMLASWLHRRIALGTGSGRSHCARACSGCRGIWNPLTRLKARKVAARGGQGPSRPVPLLAGGGAPFAHGGRPSLPGERVGGEGNAAGGVRG